MNVTPVSSRFSLSSLSLRLFDVRDFLWLGRVTQVWRTLCRQTLGEPAASVGARSWTRRVVWTAGARPSPNTSSPHSGSRHQLHQRDVRLHLLQEPGVPAGPQVTQTDRRPAAEFCPDLLPRVAGFNLVCSSPLSVCRPPDPCRYVLYIHLVINDMILLSTSVMLQVMIYTFLWASLPAASSCSSPSPPTSRCACVCECVRLSTQTPFTQRTGGIVYTRPLSVLHGGPLTHFLLVARISWWSFDSPVTKLSFTHLKLLRPRLFASLRHSEEIEKELQRCLVSWRPLLLQLCLQQTLSS